MNERNLYLSEILDRDGIDYGGNNLILSPVGSTPYYGFTEGI